MHPLPLPGLNTAPIISALIAFGMALAFILADRESPTSRALSSFLAAVGVSILVTTQIELAFIAAAEYPAWGGLFAMPEVLAFLFGYEWLLRVRRTIPAGHLNIRFGDNALRVAQGLALVYAALALALPYRRIHEFNGVGLFAGGLQPGFFLFAVPLAASLALGITAGLITLRRRPDIAERKRLVAFAAAAPFMASSMVLPVDLAPLAGSLGMLVLLVGAVQYHVIQGQRAQFLSRFLAPQVAQLVREHGMGSATHDQNLELSVVCCDLRGFTAYSTAADSARVVQILREYYEAHARRALTLAGLIREAGRALAARWSQGEQRLGVGIGVASGRVTVGVIGEGSRLEYAAVGPAVNLAARLCAEAAHGEVRVDTRTGALAGAPLDRAALVPAPPLALKGFGEPVPNFLLQASPA
jgi:adenylate cyclase